LVFGAQAGKSALENSGFKILNSGFDSESEIGNLQSGMATAVKKRVKRIMWERVGILRDKGSLQRALREFEQIEQANLGTSSRNFVTLAKLIATAALFREESRGGHFRTDFPERNDERWQVHSIQKLGAEISSSEKINFVG
jgi:L-aspartate oxidase